MDELVHIIYCSRADGSLTPTAIMDMVAQAQDKNRSAGISGMLLFGNGNFLQAIEGPRRAVNQLYHRIVRDDRHHDVLIIDFEYKQQRDFSKWGMGLYDIARCKEAQIRALCGDRFEPFSMGRAQCVELLHRSSDCLSLAG